MNPRHPNVGTIGHIDHGQKAEAFGAWLERMEAMPENIPFKPTHWPPRLTRMALAVRMGTTRMLLERRP